MQRRKNAKVLPFTFDLLPFHLLLFYRCLADCERFGRHRFSVCDRRILLSFIVEIPVKNIYLQSFLGIACGFARRLRVVFADVSGEWLEVY